MSHHKSFSIHANKVSAKRCRTEISRNYIANQIMKLCHKIIKNVKKILNAEHFISLIQKEKLTYSIKKAVTRRSRMNHCNS